MEKRKRCIYCNQIVKLKYGDVYGQDIASPYGKLYSDHYYYECKACGGIEVVLKDEDTDWLD